MFLLKKPRSYWRAGLECRGGGGRPGSRRNKPLLPPLRGPNFYVAVGRSAGVPSISLVYPSIHGAWGLGTCFLHLVNN